MAKQIFDPVKLGKVIRAKRKEKGLQQNELAKKVGCTDVYMNNLEQGVHLPSGKLMKKIFDVLEIKMTVTVE